tara:strand:+ start:365 stop:670 length:306 start_codon:yes stop_codon:yes gene_type:complete
MQQLENEQAILNLIGKDSAVKFEHLLDGVIRFETVLPKLIGGNHTEFRIDVFYEEMDGFFNDILAYETLEFAMNKRQVFEVYQVTNGYSVNIYHRKWEGVD